MTFLDHDGRRTEVEPDSDGLLALMELCESQRALITSLRTTLETTVAARKADTDARRVFAHDVANPLTALLGLLETLRSGQLDEATAEDFLGRALRQIQGLRELVETYSYQEQDLTPVARAPQERVALHHLVEDGLAGLAEREKSRVSLEAPSWLELHTIPTRVQRILANLIANAVKYSPPDTPVTVEAAITDGAVEISITDTGPGIDPDLARSLFEPFRRGPGTEDRPGSGIGLYVVEQLTQTLGGTVELRPASPHGTVAVVRLPQQRSDDPAVQLTAARTQPTVAQPRSFVLVVEDDPAVAEAACRAMRRDGHDAEVVPDGDVAVAAVITRPPDLVLLDLALPDRDGMDVLAAIRRHSDVPVLVLSGRSAAEQRVAALREGADDFVGKPFTGEELSARASVLLRRTRRTRVECAVEAGPVRVDLSARVASVSGDPVALTAREFDLLAHLAANPDRTYTRAELLRAVWSSSEHWQSTTTVTEHIRRLRNKLTSADPRAGALIETVRGVGYRVSSFA